MNKTRTVKINFIFIICIVFLFGIIIIRLLYVGLSKEVDGINLKKFAEARNTVKEKINAKRGTIYDKNGEILAQDVNSYTVIAYLSESRTTDPDKPYHVVDKEYTAQMLAPLINMSKESILNLLNRDAYQVELGPGGRGLTELVKDEIKALNLPGIDFITSVKRYYPNSDFLSYTLGYAKTTDDGNIVGEFGLELYYNDILTGKNGFKKYQQDLYGYQMVNTPYILEAAIPGNEIYLTIDTNIQMFTEQTIITLENAGLEWATVSVVNAKTGEILGVASSPSFNPNIKDITSYYDPFVSYVYEPGSTMKTFSFMAAIENGLYNGDEKYNSGTITIDDVKIKDWNDDGWGKITFNQGFMASSNVAASMLAKKLDREKLYNFYYSLGLGEPTGITLPNELTGKLGFKYDVEVANASFGQGMSITPVQMIQAITCLSNDGNIIKPYIIKKIVNPNNKKTIYKGKREVIRKVAQTSTINTIKDLMRGVIDGRVSMSTGKQYYIDGYDIIGKTGTAQIAGSNGYLKGYYDYVRSFVGLFPGDDPEIIIYVAVSKLRNPNILPTSVKALIKDLATYLNIYEKDELNSNLTVDVKSYINKDVEETKNYFIEKRIEPIIIGNGNKIIKQYPSKGLKISTNEKIFLLTNETTYKYPHMTNWSRLDVTNFANMIGLSINFNGYGYVTSTNIIPNSIIDISKTLEVNLEPKYNKRN